MMSVSPWIVPRLLLTLVLALETGAMSAAAVEKKKGSSSPKKGKAFVPAPLPTPPPAPDNPKTKGGTTIERLPTYTTPPAVAERLKKAFPRTFAKLSQRQPVHVMVVGDEMVNMAGQGDVNGNQLLAWPVKLINELAQEFYYTGGVRLIRPNPGQPERALEAFGPEITVRVLPENGGTMAKAMSILATFAYEAPPDLVIVSFGANDALAGTDLMDYAKNLHRVVETIRARGADLWLAGPTLMAGNQADNGLGATRPFAGIMRDEAAEAGAAFSDLGDLTPLVRLEPEMQAPDRVLGTVGEQYLEYFAWEGAKDVVHPLPQLHQRLATHAYRSLSNPPAEAPWKTTVSGVTFQPTGAITVTGTLTNPGKKELKLTVAPLKMPRWSPKTEPYEVVLKAGATAPFSLAYDQSATPRTPWFPAFAGHEPWLRLPVLMTAASTTRIEELKAEIKPLAVMWKLDTLYNQEDRFTVDNVVLNTSGADQKGVAWAAEWNGQTKSGTADIAKDGSTTLPLSFDLPKGAGPSRVAAPLRLTLTVNSTTLKSDRAVEINRNVGLKQERPLTLMGDGKGNVALTMAADDQSLLFAFDVSGRALEAGPDGVAISAELHLDARSYGKRLMLGSTEGITVSAGATDGDAKVGRIMPWAFGTGYGMKFDERAVKASLSTNLGASTLTVAVPRSFLYLHEWAINNGNSQMGLNAIVRLSSAQGGNSPDRTWSLTLNGKHADDVEGTAVLELTDKPTSRWTVVVW